MFYKRTKTEETVNALNNSLLQQDWSAVYNEADVDSAYNTFLDMFLSSYDKHCPVNEYSMRTKCNKSPWLTKGIINACKKKNNLCKM